MSFRESAFLDSGFCLRRNGTLRLELGTAVVDGPENLEIPDFPETRGPVEVTHFCVSSSPV